MTPEQMAAEIGRLHERLRHEQITASVARGNIERQAAEIVRLRQGEHLAKACATAADVAERTPSRPLRRPSTSPTTTSGGRARRPPSRCALPARRPLPRMLRRRSGRSSRGRWRRSLVPLSRHRVSCRLCLQRCRRSLPRQGVSYDRPPGTTAAYTPAPAACGSPGARGCGRTSSRWRRGVAAWTVACGCGRWRC